MNYFVFILATFHDLENTREGETPFSLKFQIATKYL